MRRVFSVAAAVVMVAAIAARPGDLIPRHSPPISGSSAAFGVGFNAGDLPGKTRLALADRPTPRIVLGVKTARRLIALTFDLDMTPAMAEEIRAGTSWFSMDALAFLQSQRIHATMFMTGMWAELYPTIARQIAQDHDFEIGNHSFSHPAFHLPCYSLGSVNRAAQAAQIQMAQQAITWVTGLTPRYFRFPGGCYDRQAVDLVHAAGLIPVEWNVNSIDAFNPHPAQIATVVVDEARPGSIVIMHLQAGINAPATAEALRLLIPALERRGYQFVTVSELLDAGPPIEPSDPRELVEAAPPPTPTPTVPQGPRVIATSRPVLPMKPTPRWCGWVTTATGRFWVCR